ncbi:hypothetical protein [Micromonospora noduli]|uniref:hypothetical protein n=1 Tax=Micromonospora noduli TaxID=709876 RepID=UPI0011BEA846|nr:hypothetical protein [Micromonospora noduli]
MQEQEQEPTRPTPYLVRAWRFAGPALEVTALMAAHQQREGLAVTAKALAVLGQSATIWFAGRERR